MKRIRKVFLITAIVIFSVAATGFILLSPIAEYLIEKNSITWTGRKIEMKSLWINLLNGSATVNGLKIYEADQKSEFITLNKLYVNITLYKAFFGTYDLTEITLHSLTAVIKQNGSSFNFDDIVKKFSSGEKDTVPAGEPAHWFIRKLALYQSTLKYASALPPAEFYADNLDIVSQPIAYNNPLYGFDIRFVSRTGGNLHATFDLDTKKEKYAVHAISDNLNLSGLLPYVEDYLFVDSINGLLNTNLIMTGNLNKSDDIALSGTLSANRFSLTDTTGDRLASFEQLLAIIDSLNPLQDIYDFKKIALIRPEARIAMYDSGFNFNRITTATTKDTTGNAPVEDYSNIFKMMADYIKEISKSYLITSYEIDSLSVTHGALQFQDFTMEEQFNYILDSTFIAANNVSSKNEKIHVDLHARLNRSGEMSGYLDVYTKNLDDKDIYYKISNMLISDINPYSKYYVATKFLEGSIFFTSNTTIHDNYLKSENNFRVEQISVTDKTGHAIYDLPVKLAVSLLTDLKGNIDLDIPVKGDLNDPKFNVWKVLWQVLKNIMIKAVTAPYRLLAGSYGGNEQDFREIRFNYMQQQLSVQQENNLAKIAKVLTEKPGMKAEMVQLSDDADEAAYIALFEMKRQFLSISTSDSMTMDRIHQVENVSVKDSAFVQFVNRKYNRENNLISIQEKCMEVYGNNRAAEQAALQRAHRNKLLQDFLAGRQVTTVRCQVHDAKTLPANMHLSAPLFQVNYAVAEPDSLVQKTKE